MALPLLIDATGNPADHPAAGRYVRDRPGHRRALPAQREGPHRAGRPARRTRERDAAIAQIEGGGRQVGPVDRLRRRRHRQPSRPSSNRAWARRRCRRGRSWPSACSVTPRNCGRTRRKAVQIAADQLHRGGFRRRADRREDARPGLRPDHRDELGWPVSGCAAPTSSTDRPRPAWTASTSGSEKPCASSGFGCW